MIIWLDCPYVPRGTSYVALSKLRSLEDLNFMVYSNAEQFLPVEMLRVLFLFSLEMAYQINSPNKAYGVQYYNQFTKHFLKPHGKLKDSLEEETILKEIKPINCEYLVRPKIWAKLVPRIMTGLSSYLGLGIWTK